MDNNVKNRSMFFGDKIVPYNGEMNSDEEKYSYIDGKLVHIESLTKDEAKGYDIDGHWFAAKNSFGILAIDKLIAKAEAKIAKIEQEIDSEKKYNQFIDTFEKNEMYDCYDFFQWYRRLTGACYTGRKKFMKEHNIDMWAKATPTYFLKITVDNNVANDLIRKLYDYYKGSKEMYETTNPDTTV